jgi:hypothetical protein
VAMLDIALVVLLNLVTIVNKTLLIVLFFQVLFQQLTIYITTCLCLKLDGELYNMKKILTLGSEVIGPVQDIIETEDRYIVGNVHMQYSIVGKGVITEVPDDYGIEQPTEILVEDVPTEGAA